MHKKAEICCSTPVHLQMRKSAPSRVPKTVGDTTLLTWDAVISKRRDVASNGQVGWHVVELEIHNTVMGTATRFMLTDPVFLANRGALDSRIGVRR